MPVGSIAAARRRSTGSGTQFGALVRKSSGQVISTTNAALTWDTEVYDTTGWHDVINTERLTVPSGISLVRIASNALMGVNAGVLQHFKGGSVVRGGGKADTGPVGGANDYINIVSAPLAVSAGDYFDTGALVDSGSNSITNDEETWFAIEKLDSATKYALVYHSASQALSAGVALNLAFDSEVADTDGWHSNVTNNSRLTVPSGVTLIRLSGNSAGGNVAGRHVSRFSVNGTVANVRGLPSKNTDTGSEDHNNIISAPLVVTPGDYFEFTVSSTNATSVPTGENIWFAIEEVPSTYKRALVYKSAGTQTFTAATPGTVSWDAEVYDTDSMHNNVTSNSRLVVPTGCTKARASFSLVTSSATGHMQGWVFKNAASDFYGMPGVSCDTVGADRLSAMGAWVDVVPGDYFQVGFVSTVGCTLGTDNETWFCLECQ